MATLCVCRRRHLCVILARIVATTSDELDPSTIEPIVRVAHSVSINAFGAFSASGKSPLFFFSENLTAPLYVSILESTVLPAARDWFPWRTLDLFTRQRSEAHCEIDARLVACQCARIYHAGAVATALTRPQPHRERLGIGRKASLASPAKNARGVETCSGRGVDGGDDGGVLHHSG